MSSAYLHVRFHNEHSSRAVLAESTKRLSKEIEMDPAAKLYQELMRTVEPIEEATERGDSEVQRFYQDAVLFITGGTGFMGKQLLEKLFRSCDIKKAFILVRPKKGRSVQERFQDMLNDSVFDLVRKKKQDLASRLVCVEGDVALIQLGMSNDDWNMIVEEVDVIFHLAATVRFDENIRTAAIMNVGGTREALELGRACKKLKSFVHVSTAFCHATADRAGKEIREQFYRSPMSADDLLALVNTVDSKELDDITQNVINGWPNTYTFTKAVAEELVRTESGNIPICIVRPCIVSATYHEPSPGWMDLSCLYGPSGMILGAATGVIRVVYVNNTLKLSYVPLDMVNNAIIAAGWDTSFTKYREPMIYTISSTKCGLTFKHVTDRTRKCRPLATPVMLWYSYLIETNNRLVYWFLTWILHYIPAYIVDAIIDIFKIKKPKALKSFVYVYTKYQKLCSVYSYFLTHEWDFDDTNLMKLYQKMSQTDRTIYSFDINSLNWEEYSVRACLGSRKYVLKDGLKGTEAAVAKQKWLKAANFAVLICYLAVTWTFCSWLYWLVMKMF